MPLPQVSQRCDKCGRKGPWGVRKLSMKDYKGTGLYVFRISLQAVWMENGEYPNVGTQTNTPIPSHPFPSLDWHIHLDAAH